MTTNTSFGRLRMRRNGVANLFMLFAPLEGWRHVKVTDRHAAVDYALVLKDLSGTHFPEASKIVLVQDNLSTHATASLYAAFPAAEARRLAERFEWHYTPDPRLRGDGSWLDPGLRRGKLWQNPNSPCSQPSVWTAASPTRQS